MGDTGIEPQTDLLYLYDIISDIICDVTAVPVFLLLLLIFFRLDMFLST